MVVVGLEAWTKWGDSGQRVQVLSYKMKHFWRSNVQHSDYS